MCVIAVAWQLHPEWALAVIANRDELHERPAQPLARWTERGGIIAGKDVEQGGTWLGISEDGRFAGLVNVRGATAGNRPSRGQLAFAALSGEVARLEELSNFNPFNLLCATPFALTLATNSPEPATRSLSSGVHAISNVQVGGHSPRAALAKHSLILLLSRPSLHTRHLLDIIGPPRSSGKPGREDQVQTSLFIEGPVYGTRCSTAVLVDRSGRGTIHERRFDSYGDVTGETQFQFRWPR